MKESEQFARNGAVVNDVENGQVLVAAAFSLTAERPLVREPLHVGDDWFILRFKDGSRTVATREEFGAPASGTPHHHVRLDARRAAAARSCSTPRASLGGRARGSGRIGNSARLQALDRRRRQRRHELNVFSPLCRYLFIPYPYSPESASFSEHLELLGNVTPHAQGMSQAHCEPAREGISLGTMHTASFTRLSNGLRMVTVPPPSSAPGGSTHVGSRHETRATNGISHFLEHMFSAGRSVVHGLGVQPRYRIAGRHALGRHARRLHPLRTDHSPRRAGLGVHAARGGVHHRPVRRPGTSRASSARRSSKTSTKTGGISTPTTSAARGSSGLIPWASPSPGASRTSNASRPTSLGAHLDRYYVARNMVVCVTGPLPPVDGPRGRAGLHRPHARLGHVHPDVPLKQRGAHSRGSNAGGRTSVRIAFPTQASMDARARALELLMRVLDGMSTRLHRRICDERGLAYEVSAGVRATSTTRA